MVVIRGHGWITTAVSLYGHLICHIVADPQDPNIVYSPNRKVWKSVDGGRSFVQLNTPYVDQHDLWVAPTDSQRMIIANDGGAAVSFNGGTSWSTLNKPTDC